MFNCYELTRNSTKLSSRVSRKCFNMMLFTLVLNVLTQDNFTVSRYKYC